MNKQERLFLCPLLHTQTNLEPIRLKMTLLRETVFKDNTNVFQLFFSISTTAVGNNRLYCYQHSLVTALLTVLPNACWTDIKKADDGRRNFPFIFPTPDPAEKVRPLLNE